MLLTISTTHRPATDLGYLLHKHPDRFQSFELNFGAAHVYYPEVSEDRCTVVLALEVDGVELMRGENADKSFTLGQYVNDRPYVASSFISVAISQVLSSAMNGSCKTKPELPTTLMPLTATIEVLPASGGEKFVRGVFEPLGYTVTIERHPLDDHFPEWGMSRYITLQLEKTTTLSDLLSQLYVLIPVFDGRKHYYFGPDEIQKLLDKGEGWLAAHPLRDEITRRYLHHRASLYKQAIAKLEDELPDTDDEPIPANEETLEKPIRLNDERHDAVVKWLQESGATRVIDLGCGEGKLLKKLLAVRQFTEIVGVDVTIAALEIASRRLKMDAMPVHQQDRIRLLHGSLMYRDKRFAGFDAACIVEVIEHLDPPRLAAFERVVFEFARPKTIIVTTPNEEYNAVWESLPAGEFRHNDHRFEWTRAEFQTWASHLAETHGYSVTYHAIGPVHETYGSPTQAAVWVMK